MLSCNVLKYGSEKVLPEQISLRAGPLTLVCEEGGLRWVRLGTREILRGVYVAVRDRNWMTIPAVLTDIRMEVLERSFRVFYTATHHQDDVHFSWQAEIAGDEDGAIRFTMDGQAHSSFWRNRIGFCLLHPMAECAGQSCQVAHSDGSVEDGAFPSWISPHQPFREMQGIAYEVSAGVRAEITFSGDVFEMEDQRNWTDASFKTYCTPLDKPYPVWVEAGTRVKQSVMLRLQGAPTLKIPEISENVSVVRLGETSPVPMPRLGVGIASHGHALSPGELQRLKALHLDHLRVDLWLNEADYPDHLRQTTDEVQAMDASLHVALHLSGQAEQELAHFQHILAEVKPPIAAWLVFHTAEKTASAQWANLVRQSLASAYPHAKLIGGTDAYFAELNRERPLVEVLDGVTYSINPQVHAFDNDSLVETLAAQAATVESARQFCGNLPLMISPITLKPRFNPNATGLLLEPSHDMLPDTVDPRQMSLFAAVWTLGSIARLAEHGVASATYYETTGWRGLMETEQGTPLPSLFHSLAGAVFPVYFVQHWIGAFAEGKMQPMVTTRPAKVVGMHLMYQSRERILLANLTDTVQTVQVGVGSSADVWMQMLDERNAEEAMRSPEDFLAQLGTEIQISGGRLDVELRPFAVVRLDRG